MLRRHHKDGSPVPPGRGKYASASAVKVTGTVVDSPDAAPGAAGPAFLVTAASHDYVIEIPAPNGTLIRATVSTFSRIVHQVGAPFHVEIEPRTGVVSVDHHAMSLVATKLMKEHAAEIPGSQAQAEARRSTPSTFDPIPGGGQPGGFAEPAVTSFGDRGGSFGPDVPPPPDPYPPVSPPDFGPPPESGMPDAGSLAAYGPGGSFDLGPGQGSKQQQLARLKQLLDKGILTESEYQEQRRVVTGGH